MVVNLTDGLELESYEGMVVRFNDVVLADRGIFGEYTLRNSDATESGGAVFNEDIGSSEIGNTNAESDYNHTVRSEKPFTAYAVVTATFGNPTFQPRDADDIIAVDGNAFTPTLDFPLLSPANGASVVVDNDIEVSWNTAFDFDGDDLTYEWVLYSSDTLTVIATVPSNSNATETAVTLPYATVDGLLADAGLANGESADFVWNVRVSDGLDTLDVRGSYGNFGDDWEPIYRELTLERSTATSNDEEFGTPNAFALEQNYPNPFNPSTTIKFALPTTSNVTLTVYNMLGQKVSTLINDKMNAGFHSVPFDASNLASGMYIYRIEAASFTSIKKMLLIK
jgi:hypothetical protein